MHYFHYKKNKLFCEAVSLAHIANTMGTPCYVYSSATVKRHFKAFQKAFQKSPHLVCYSVKANSNLSILKLLSRLGAGFDIVSEGELFRVIKSGGDPKKVVFSGVGKREDEIRYALQKKILCFNVESAQELRKINTLAQHLRKKAPVSLRVNPNINPKTHPYIATGLKENKFGIPIREAIHLYKEYRQYPYLQFIGIDCHIGSQILTLSPILETVRELKKMILTIQSFGLSLEHVNLGGGLGIPYTHEEPPSPQQYITSALKELKDLKLKLLIEPGRAIVGNAGILITKVLYTKKMPQKNFVIVDGAMNDLIRPTLYGAHQDIWPVKKSRRMISADIVGPICESGDFLGKNRKLPLLNSEDLLAIMSAGAYGFSMSSNYNSRPRTAEVLVDGNKFRVCRRREDLQDLIRGEYL